MKILFTLIILSFYLGSSNLYAHSFKGNDENIKYVGRTISNSNGDVSFNWIGTYLETYFTGGDFSLRISETGTSYYNIFIDDKLQRKIKLSGLDTIVNIVSDYNKRKHKIRIQKCTEGVYSKTTIHEVILSKSGLLSRQPSKVKRHIEFIGDSYTCGYGVESNNYKDPFSLETENCSLTYAAVIAKYFDADYTLIAHSGKGAARNYGDSVRISKETMKDLMMNIFDTIDTCKWDGKGYKPDLVVINLGSNDFSLEPHPYKEEFKHSYIQIINQVKTLYGNVKILCIFPPTIQAPVYNYFEEIVSEKNDGTIYLLKLKQDLFNMETDLGANWHPGRYGQRKTAMCIIPYISTIVGWEIQNE